MRILNYTIAFIFGLVILWLAIESIDMVLYNTKTYSSDDNGLSYESIQLLLKTIHITAAFLGAVFLVWMFNRKKKGQSQ